MIKNIYKESFSENGIKSPFNDFLIFKDFHKEVLSLEEEQRIKRVYASLNRILNLILYLHKVEKKEQDEMMDVYIIRAVHESLCTNFRSVIGTGIWFLHKYTNTEFEDVSECLHNKHTLKLQEQHCLELRWFDASEILLSSIAVNSHSLKIVGGKKDAIKFQLYDDDLNTVFANPDLTNEENLISSVSYFSFSFLELLRYCKLMLKCVCIEHFAVKNYNKKITEIKNQNQKEDAFILLDNCEEIMQIYETILNSRVK